MNILGRGFSVVVHPGRGRRRRRRGRGGRGRGRRGRGRGRRGRRLFCVYENTNETHN